MDEAGDSDGAAAEFRGRRQVFRVAMACSPRQQCPVQGYECLGRRVRNGRGEVGRRRRGQSYGFRDVAGVHREYTVLTPISNPAASCA